ncbi:MAG: class GN sortase [Gammaproteobacteria bacterium]
MRTKLLHCVALALLSIGAFQFGHGVWIDFKAHLAQHLISQAWQRTLMRQAPVKPWPWADTWPVARLRWQHGRDGVDLYVLAGINGASLPFGPGMDNHMADNGRNKVLLIAGHRDTHCAFLARVQPGDRLTLTDMHDHRKIYQVTNRKVVDTRRATLVADTDRPELILVTCYPFDALRAGGPLRFVVTALPTNLVKHHAEKQPSTGTIQVSYGVLNEQNPPYPL